MKFQNQKRNNSIIKPLRKINGKFAKQNTRTKISRDESNLKVELNLVFFLITIFRFISQNEKKK